MDPATRIFGASPLARKDETAVLEELLNDGWRYHDTESERLAIALEAAAEDGIAPGLLAPFLDLGIHTIGEHLGDWPRALRLGRKAIGGQVPVLETARPWAQLHVAAILAGDYPEAADFEFSYAEASGRGFDAVLDLRFMLAAALIASGRAAEGGRLYRRALDLAGQMQPAASLDRAIAIAGNNIGWELYEMPRRTRDENDLMRRAAGTSLESWLRCGTWINAERAHYLNALVAIAAGDSEAGLNHADAALAIIAANGARPLDTAQLHLARAAALGALGDAAGRAGAIGDADAAAAGLGADLKARFDAARAKVAIPSSDPILPA
ncbi:MAG TPA: hypothetical protein VFW19_07030 [Allosphingosinicella sp.]|nr:hypothetical protein [Allosphingosinicella sp.]